MIISPGKISSSIMCANFRNLEGDIKLLEQAGVEYLHFDIMDGSFVPNFALGSDLVKTVRNITDTPLDIHLMVWRPENHIDLFEVKPGEIVSIHQESTVHLQKTLQKIKACGGRPAIALNPATPIYCIGDVLDDIELILIMTVNPGFAGQKLVPATLKKIANMRNYLDEQGYGHIEIEVDGNVNLENAKKMREAGADIFVAGSSGLFIKGFGIAESASRLRECIA